MNYRFPIILLIAMLIAGQSFAYVIRGTYSQPVLDGNIAEADEKARENSMLNALKNYFDTLKQNEPDKVIPDVTPEFFKFIKSYKIAERKYVNDTVVYTILADVDDVALNDLTFFVENAVNTVVYNMVGLPVSPERDQLMNTTFAEYKFDTRHQSDFQASLPEQSSFNDRITAFHNGLSQYFMDISTTQETVPAGECSIILTSKLFSKTKEFQTLKIQSSAENPEETACYDEVVTDALGKVLAYIRENIIALTVSEKVLSTFNLISVNYDNFATPKKIMEELKKRSFIDSYRIISFAGNKLHVEVQTYINSDVLIKKLESIEKEYGFTSQQEEQNNILLDFTK